MMARTGLTNWKAAQAIAEESWPETKAEFDRILRHREPSLDCECVIEGAAFNDVIRFGEILAAAPHLEHPDVIGGVSTRALGRLRDGVFLDMISYGGPFDEQNGIADTVRQLKRLSQLG